MIRKVAVALDGSEAASKSLDLAIEFAVAFGAELVLLHIISDQMLTDGERRLANSEYHDELQRALSGSALATLLGLSSVTTESVIQASHEAGLAVRTVIGRGIVSRAEEKAKAKHVSLVRSVLQDGDPATELLVVAKQEKPDLFLMGTRGLGGVERLFNGSVSQKVSNSAVCTVVIVR
jgi:nucleotide-binding universal stress UspA family protein